MSTEKKKLYRSHTDRMIAGVCGGMANYFDLDSTVVRLVFVIATFLGGPGLLAYILCLVLMPLEPEDTPGQAVIEVAEPPESE